MITPEGVNPTKCVTRHPIAIVAYIVIMNGWFMVFNATFNNISVISWLSVLLEGKPENPEKTTALSQVTEKLIT